MSTAVVKRGTAPGRHVYDAIVIGGQLAGALTTALLARRGLQVLHVPHDGLAEGYLHGGVRLPLAPFLAPPPRLVPSLEEALQELGLAPAVHRALAVQPLQLLRPGGRLELTHDEKRRGPELARALGEQAEGVDALLRRAEAAADASAPYFASRPDLPPEGLFGRWRFRRHLARFPGALADSPLPDDDFLRRLMPFVAGVVAPAPLTAARALGRTLAGPAAMPGGREALWALLAERARELGADVLAADEAVEQVTLEGTTVGVRLARTDTVYRAGLLAAAVDLDELARLVPEKRRAAADAALAALAAPQALFCLNLVLPERALPRGLGALALLEAPALEGGALLLQVTPGPTAEQRVVTAAVPAPLAVRRAGEPAVRALIAQVHQALEVVMPFSLAHASLESTPWLDAPSVVAGRGEPAPRFALPAGAWCGVAGLGTASPWKRVVLASRQVLPGLGLEGEVLAAQRAARSIEVQLDKRDPLKARKPT